MTEKSDDTPEIENSRRRGKFNLIPKTNTENICTPKSVSVHKNHARIRKISPKTEKLLRVGNNE